MKFNNKYQLAFYLLILAYIIYALLYIYKSSFIVAGERYFVLFDDAMVSMRYARNLAQGYGWYGILGVNASKAIRTPCGCC